MKAATEQKTVRQGSLSIQIRRYADQRFGFDFSPPAANGGGKVRKKVRKKTLDAAEKRARELLGIAVAGKVERLAIDESEYAEFLRWKAARRAPKPIPDLVSEFLALQAARREAQELTDKYCNDIAEILKVFAANFSGAVSDLSRVEVERWLNSRGFGPKRWNHYRAAIVALIRFARVDLHVGAAKTPVEQIPKRKTTARIETYTPEELRRILAAVCAPRLWIEQPQMWLPVIVLGAFAGLRPEEICPAGKKPGLRWENLLWTKNKIDVPAAVSKTRRRRFAPLLPAARAFLDPWRTARGPIAPAKGRLCDQTRTWAKVSGVPWKYDALRHSFASYRLAVTKDMAALALEMGNSPQMIHDHYLDLKHDEEGEEWFAIRPADCAKSSKSSDNEHPQNGSAASSARRPCAPSAHQ